MSRFEEASESSTASQAATLSLAGLEVLALQNNPTLFQAQAAVSAQQGTHRQAGLNPNPQVGYLNGSASNSAVRQSNGVFHYQVRNWLGWHHHQTLSLIAAWFLNEETRRGKNTDTRHDGPSSSTIDRGPNRTPTPIQHAQTHRHYRATLATAK